MKNRFFWLAGGAMIALAILAFSGLRLLADSPARYRGSLIEAATPAPDFTLTGEDGQPYTLSSQNGKVVLLFFGYTSCPDVCPATMAEFSRLRENLKDKASQVSFVLVTVDPQRDDPATMSNYLANFDPAIHGLTGTPEELATVWKDYGVAVEYTPGPTPDAYEVGHTSRVYAIDRHGNLRLTYSFGTSLADLENDVRLLMREKAG